MGDSGDEYSRQPRDKFQRERSDQYERRGREREYGRERGWNPPAMSGSDMKSGGMRSMGEPRHRPPDYPMAGPHEMKRRFSPGREADMRGRKRMRYVVFLLGVPRPFEPGFDGGWGWNPRPAFHPREEWGQGDRGIPHPVDMQPSGPKMLTFKQWLHNQKDDITDEEAVKNYTEYKVFRRQQLQEFFIAHKDEEWFKEKYEPDEADKRFGDQRSCIMWRAEVFSRLLQLDPFDLVDLDLANEERIIKVLDSAVIMMEGGNDDDLSILDADPNTVTHDEQTQPPAQAKTDETTEEADPKKTPMKVLDSLTEEQYELKKQAELYKQLLQDNPDADKVIVAVAIDVIYCNLKLILTQTEADTTDGKDKIAEDEEKTKSDSDQGKSDTEGTIESIQSDNKEEQVEKQGEEGEGKCRLHLSLNKPKHPSNKVKSAPKARALHQTHSIFMRNLPPSVTKLEIVNLCKKFPGGLSGVGGPGKVKFRFFRRCWVTFDRTVNIKDICWNLNNLRLRDLELNPVVNRDLSRRVRPISGIAQHVQCARNDLRNVARLIMHLDQKWKLWEKKDEDKQAEGEDGNPWLRNISEYLVDEMDAEEAELVGEEGAKQEGEEQGAAPIVKITRDEKLIKVLDRLLYYLRIVHSVDYYNASEYPCEDEMPNRCGIMHARGPIPPNMLTKSDINEFQKRFNDKLAHILNFKERLTDEEAKKLGPKVEDEEVEKFISANTEELGKDKWLCPLSGKKFKGPDYIRKHIFNKHGDKLDAVRKEVKYFNNYLMDPRRPGPMEGQAGKPPAHPAGPPAGYNGPPRGFGPPPPSTPPYRGDPERPPNPYGNGTGRTYPPKGPRMGDPYSSRPIVGYQDLDAPEDTDFF
uniref:Arsenite-resistance protein 2 homolog n=1 Tax=Ciona savignyi TaxID=51511 RepID=H2Z9S0_CIOSA